MSGAALWSVGKRAGAEAPLLDFSFDGGALRFIREGSWLCFWEHP